MPSTSSRTPRTPKVEREPKPRTEICKSCAKFPRSSTATPACPASSSDRFTSGDAVVNGSTATLVKLAAASKRRCAAAWPSTSTVGSSGAASGAEAGAAPALALMPVPVLCAGGDMASTGAGVGSAAMPLLPSTPPSTAAAHQALRCAATVQSRSTGAWGRHDINAVGAGWWGQSGVVMGRDWWCWQGPIRADKGRQEAGKELEEAQMQTLPAPAAATKGLPGLHLAGENAPVCRPAGQQVASSKQQAASSKQQGCGRPRQGAQRRLLRPFASQKDGQAKRSQERWLKKGYC